MVVFCLTSKLTGRVDVGCPVSRASQHAIRRIEKSQVLSKAGLLIFSFSCLIDVFHLENYSEILMVRYEVAFRQRLTHRISGAAT